MEELTKREEEIVANLALREASRIAEVRTKGLTTAPQRRVFREKENELLTIVRKVLTDNSSM